MLRRKGFTLIELLVVIAIIAILAAILFPVFARARSKAKQTACLSNMKELALSVLMYTSDHDGVLPLVWYASSPSWTGWIDVTEPYVKNQDIYKCPAVFQQYPGIGYNVHLGLHTPSPSPVSEEEVEFPAEVIVVGDSAQGSRYGFFRPLHWAAEWQRNSYCIQARHNGGPNAAFVDGHAKWISRDESWKDEHYLP